MLAVKSPLSALKFDFLALKAAASQLWLSFGNLFITLFLSLKSLNQLRLWAINVDKASKQTQDDIDEMYDHMANTLELLQKHNIKCTLIAGSALGQARHGGIIPWDNDVDLGILESDQDKIMALREEFEAKGILLVRSDIGIKSGSGSLRVGESMIQEIDGEYWAIGPEDPFTGVNQDLFTFKVDDEKYEEDGVQVMRYAGSRAIATWPGEVLPVSGWNNLVSASFGGFAVKILDSEWMNWYLSRCYGLRWKTHDGFGNEIKDFSCRVHSKK